jgi:ATP-dependent Clp protease ATP-binding subunit ClpC
LRYWLQEPAVFERFTESARKSVFFARYEASAAGTLQIEATHLLLGILRADEELATRLVGPPDRIDRIRQRVFEAPSSHASIPLNADLPLSHEAKRAMAHAAEEAAKRQDKHITAEHLLLGLVREKDAPVALLLREVGVSMKKMRAPAPRPAPQDPEPARPAAVRNLTAAAAAGALDPVIGRAPEIDQVIQILLRRGKNWVALIGEPGVGKTAVLHGLAQRISDGAAAQFLAARTVLSLEAFRVPKEEDLGRAPMILCLEGLFDLADQGGLETLAVAEPLIKAGDSHLIATGTPEGLARFPAPLARLFERVDLAPPAEAEAIRIVIGVKERYERFHAVSIAEEVARAAVVYSRRFLAHRVLPDRAIDLLDEACSRARMNGKVAAEVEDIDAVVRARTGARSLQPEQT